MHNSRAAKLGAKDICNGSDGKPKERLIGLIGDSSTDTYLPADPALCKPGRGDVCPLKNCTVTVPPIRWCGSAACYATETVTI